MDGRDDSRLLPSVEVIRKPVSSAGGCGDEAQPALDLELLLGGAAIKRNIYWAGCLAVVVVVVGRVSLAVRQRNGCEWMMRRAGCREQIGIELCT